MTVDLNILLDVAKWITALTVIYVFVRKVITPLQTMATSITLMQRERLESAYAIYCEILGWCPSGEKTVLSDIYKHYKKAGHNHIAENYIDRILELPTRPKEQGNGEEAMLIRKSL